MSDHEAVREYWLHPEVRTYFPKTMQEAVSPEATSSYLDEAIEAARTVPRTRYELAVTVQGEVVGAGRVELQNPLGPNGDMGYVLRRDMWGQGLGTEVARLLIQLGFEALGLHRIWAVVHPENVASIRVLEKAGLQYEGRLRENFQMPNGWRDSLMYAILEGEWRGSA